jgi:hypothetical protein
VTGLTAGTEYDFTITATNATGTGPAAAFPRVAAGVLPFGPSQATVSTMNATSALVTWTPSTIANEAPTRWYILTAQPSTAGASTLVKTEYAFRTSTIFKGLSTNVFYRFLVQAVGAPGYCPPFAYTSTVQIPADFPLVVGSGTSLLQYARALNANRSVQSPGALGSLSINSQAVGSHELTVADTTTISSFTAGSWFTSTADTQSAWVIVKGNLTINSGITFTPSVRKLFTVLYVRGNLVNNGTISMTARGANHSGTGNSGGATTAAAIRIATGTFSSVTNPQVPAAGGSGGSGGYSGGAGAAGTGGGTGGGGGGSNDSGGVGLGSAGTCFTGGTGGGSGRSTAGNGVANGGKGGDSNGGFAGDECAGAGNPGGNNSGDASRSGKSGTGGILIIICEGSISGTGTIVADGVRNQPDVNTNLGGGSTGGGSVTILYGGTNSITPTAAGGTSYIGGYARAGGAGGAGTARALLLA